MRKRASEPDIENPEWTEEDFRSARPALEVLPKAVVEAMAAHRRGRGPQKAATKELISLRIDRDVVEALRASGAGWQARANDALRAYAKRRDLGATKAVARKRRSAV